MNLLDLAYSLTVGPHFLYHHLVTRKYGPKDMEKVGRLPDRFNTADTTAFDLHDPYRDSPCLWLHAVSVGETVASRDLVDTFKKENPWWDLRVSTTTATARGIAEKNWGENNVFYYPLDFSWTVERAFKAIRPTLVVLMELEIWPNFLARAAQLGTPVVVANARITERSVKRLALVPWVTRNMAMAVRAWFAQTEEYAGRLAKIGVPENRIEVTGSVKYDAVPLQIDFAQARHYRRLFGCSEKPYRHQGDLLVVAGSTHPTEEKTLLEALRAATPPEKGGPRVVLAPRHPERLDEVEAMAREFGTVIRRSRISDPSAGSEKNDLGADIILVDSMGELSKIYSAADVVFVGGALVKHGGQNFIEPCGLARPTIVGPNLWNFREPADLLRKKGLIKIVDGPEDLAACLKEIILDPVAAARMGQRARQELLRQRGAARRMADRLNAIASEILKRK